MDRSGLNCHENDATAAVRKTPYGYAGSSKIPIDRQGSMRGLKTVSVHSLCVRQAPASCVEDDVDVP
jgi:hypothetical protein